MCTQEFALKMFTNSTHTWFMPYPLPNSVDLYVYSSDIAKLKASPSLPFSLARSLPFGSVKNSAN
jgi:hypothetical protein